MNVPNITAGAIKGVLKGDGILVPNKGYGGFIVDLFKNGSLFKSDTTDQLGNFFFSSLEKGNYRLSTVADFGYENIAYAEQFINLKDTLVVIDLLLDSLKYDFFALMLGATYEFHLEDVYDYSEGTTNCYHSFKSDMVVTITDSQKIGSNIYFYFEGEQTYTERINTCNSFVPDSFYLVNGSFINNNSYVSCNILNGGRELGDHYMGIHLFDGTAEAKSFLDLYEYFGPPTISFGIPFEVNNQSFETLSISGLCCNGDGHITYNYSYELPPVFIRERQEWVSATHYISQTYTITLTNFNL
ncbi:MAG: hypothetical protein OQK52_01740 [Ignavibacteriaceae bacterium]|nr:hypothetical protein [Ignavibacteriaceae bacterium]MCW9094832.1 hypothetical protein [Ignavibacteriaceae bacterium]